MTNPTKYKPSYNFTGSQTGSPTRPLPAPRVDNELANIATSMNAAIDALKDIRRSDGALRNAVVTPDSLSPATRSLITNPGTPRGDWAPAVAYAVKDLVSFRGATYTAAEAHTSGTAFSTDLDTGRWLLIASPYSISGAVFSQLLDGDGLTTTFALAQPFNSIEELAVYVQDGGAGYERMRSSGAHPQVSLAGTTQLTFSVAPGAGTQNIIVEAINQAAARLADNASLSARAAAESAGKAAESADEASARAATAATQAHEASGSAHAAAESAVRASASASATATALAAAKLVDASTTVKGLVELATTAEARAGSSTHLAVTPAGLKAAMDAATIPAATPTTPGIVRLATADEVSAGTDAEKAVTPAALARHSLVQNAFIKADPDSVVFTRTAANALSLKAGTAVEVHGKTIPFTTDTAVVMPTLTPGTDYAVYVCADGSVRADANFKAPVGYTAANARKIGGFHYAPGGNATAQSGGDTSPAINPYALWDLKFRPACKDPRGMTLVADSFWADIYLLGVNHHTDGASKYGVTIAHGSSPPKIPAAFGGNGSRTYSSLNWWEAAEVMQAHGKQLPSCAEFAALAWGTTGSGSSRTQSTALNAACTSKWGVIQATGCRYMWGRDFGGGSSSPNIVLLGISGSRSQTWGYAPSGSYSDTSARGVCGHLILG